MGRALKCGALISAILFAGGQGHGQRVRQVLHSHVRPEVTSHQAAFVNHLASDKQLQVSIVLPLRNESELDKLLVRLYDPSSADYRKFLSVAQFTEQFGPTKDDYDAVVAFAKQNGLAVNGDPANRLLVPVNGSTDQINKAFNVQMNVYQHPSESRTFFSPDREPSLDIDVPVAHISGLDDFSLPHHFSKQAKDGQVPLAVTGSGPGGSYLASDMRAAYYGGSALTGANQAIGILEFGGYLLSDVNLTFSNAGQSYSVPVNNVLLDGATGTPGSDDSEEVLDIVQAIGMAPGITQARVYIGVGSDDANILNSMASENIAKQLSCSWGWRPADPASADPFFKEMAAQGQSFFTASGDSGSFYAPINPFFFPAEDAYVTAVGGTHLTTNGAGGSWASEVVWNSQGYGSGGGISPDGIALPAWQTGVANTANAGSTTLRNVPDVAMEGDFDNYLCSLGRCSTTGAGTSFSAPRWAGFMALINQQAVANGNAPTGGLGFINPQLYLLAEGARATSDLHDIVSGNNDTGNQPIWYNAVPGYDLTTGWGSPIGQSFINDLAGPETPGFFLGSSPSLLPLNPGGSGTVKISVADAGGFTGNVSLAVTSTLPSGVTASFSPNPTADNAVLTLTTSSSTPQANTPVTVTGTSGSLSASTTFTLAVHNPTFAISVSPAAISVNQGSSGSSTITVVPQFGFSDLVTLVASGLPAGVTATFSPATTSSSSTITFAVSSTATPGTSNITVTGGSGTIASTTTIALTVTGPSFSLSTSTNVTVGLGVSATVPVTINDLYGFTGNVSLSVSGLPSGVTASFSPNPASTSSTMTLQATSAASVGQSTVTITGTSGPLTFSTKLTLSVVAPTFTLSSSSVNIGQGASGTTSIYAYAQNGFNGSVNLSTSGLPSGVTAVWSQNPVVPGYSSILTLVVSSTAKTGQYPLVVTGTSGTQTASTTFTLGIYAPTFTLSSTSGVTIGQGSTSTAYAYVTPQYGFTGSVNLSISGLPSGVTGTFSPNPTTGTSTLTLQASSTATVGQYTATVTGTSGSQTLSSNIAVSVFTPTFTLSGPGTVSLGRGGASSSGYVYVSGQYGFTGSVNLSISGLPSGVTATLATNPTTYNSMLTLTASTATALGQYTVTVTGTSGAQTASTTFTVGIYDPTYSLTGPSTISLGQGTTSTSYIYLSTQYGFSSQVNLSVSGLPAGVTASFSPNPTTYSSTLTLTASSSVSTGTYNLVITGSSGSQTATLPVTLGVYTPAFTISTSGTTIGQGSTGSTYLYLNSQYGFSGSVNFAVSGLPSGVTASFSPNPSTYSSTLTFTAASTAALGATTVTITGTSGTQTATTTLVLTVAAPAFSLSSSSASVNEGASVQDYVYINGQNGFSGSVALAVSGLPSGVTGTFAPNPSTGTSSVLTLVAGATATPGNYTVTVTGTSGSLTASTTFQLTINTPGFSLSTVPQKMNLLPGASARAAVILTATNGFSGSAPLTVSGVPTGVTASFSPASISSTSTLTLTAGSGAVPGNSTITITGTYNGVAFSTYLSLTVLAAPSSTSTTLALTAAGSAATSVAAGTMVTATATVSSASSPITAGQVNFCDAGAITCDALHLIGFAQITPAGTATLHFIPAAGSHGYRAVYVGATASAASSSPTSSLSVTNTLPTSTTISQSGAAGNYTLTGTVTGQGPAAPSGKLSFVDTSNGSATLTQAALAGATATYSLGSGQSATLGGSPAYAATGDFNGDGIPDLAVANYGSPNVTILLGKGNGTFTASNLAVGTSTSYVAVGDFNHDGNADLIILPYSGSSLFIYFGNGDGTFRQASFLPSVSYPTAVTIADFNGDGLQDLAVVSSFSGTTILFGNGDGTFTVGPSLSGVSSPRTIASGDFNGDGIADLALGSYSYDTVNILLGNGDGTFSTAPVLTVAGYPSSIVVADFNQDGKPDLAVGFQSATAASVLLGNGDGTFSGSTVATLGTSPEALGVGDFNGDGKPDLVATNYSNAAITVALGNGDGTFGAGTSATVGSSPISVVVADWNGDGITDLAAVNLGSASLTVLTGALAQRATLVATAIAPLGSGQHAVQATYPGDVSYAASTSATTSLTATAGTPAVTLSQSASSISTLQQLTVTASVNGGSGNPVPTGSVVLTSGSFTSGAVALGSGSASITAPAGSLALGTDTLTVTYTPDAGSTGNYKASTGTSSVSVAKVTPTIMLSPSGTNITTVQALTVNVTVSSGVTGSVPSGSVVLTSGTYSSAASTLSNGAASITVPAGSLPSGANSFTVAYTPDTAGAGVYNGGSATSSVTVGKVTPAVTLSLSGSNITTIQPLTVTVGVSSGTSGAVPTGSVTFSSGSYTSSAVALSGGSAGIIIPAGVLPVGTDTLSVAYTPDASGATAYNAAVGSGSVVVAKTSPAVTLSLSASSVTAVQPLTVTVTVASSASAAPTGSVMLSSGTYNSSSVALVGGSASILIPGGSLATGTDTLLATYTPDTAATPIYNVATGSGMVNLGRATPVVTLSLSSASITTVQSLTVTLGVSGGTGAAAPTGSVIVTSGSYSSASTALSGGGAMVTIPAGALPAGNDTLSVSYTPDTSGSAVYGVANAATSVTVSKVSPTVSLNLSASTITTLQPLNVTLTLSGGAGAVSPSGSMMVTSGSYNSAPTVLINGSVTVTVPAGSLAAGNDTLSVSYTPDSASAALYNAATGAGSVTVSKASPTIGLSLSATTITTLQPLTVTVSASGGGNAPTGSVVLTSGSFSSAAAALTNGSAVVTIPAGSLAAGSDTLTATYTPDNSGSSIYNNAVGSGSVAVSKVTPTLSLNLSASSVSTLQPLSVTVTASTGTSSAPTGSVVLTSGGYTSATVSFNNGSATVAVPPGALVAGSDTLSVAYTPDASGTATYNVAAASGTVMVTKAAPGVALSLSAANITTTQPFTATVTVSGGPGASALSGTITLTSGSYTSAPAAPVNGVATITVTAGYLAVGNDTVQATYTPDSASSQLYLGGSGSANIVVSTVIGTALPTVTVTPSVTTLDNLMTDTVVVTVGGVSGQPTPTGMVTLSSGSYSAQATLVSGNTTFTVAAGTLSAGADTLTATYSGDSAYAVRTGTAGVTVVPILMTTSTVTPVTAGASGTATVTLNSGSTYAGTLTLSCALSASPGGAQNLPTCKLTPASVSLASSGTVTSTFTVSTTAASHAALKIPSGLRPREYLYGAPAMAALLFFMLPKRRRRFVTLVLLMGAFAAALSGCAGGGSGNGGSQTSTSTIPGTTAGAYVFTVTATDSTSSVSTSSNVSVTVQ